MDVYLMDSSFQTIDILDDFEALVWTERFQAHGEFRLDVRERTSLRRIIPLTPKYIRTSESNRVMMVERMERNSQRLGTDLLNLRGRDVSAFLKLRNNKSQASKDAEVVTGLASTVMCHMVDKYCVNPATAGAVNVFPNLSVGDTGLGPSVHLALERGNLYDIVQAIALATNLGFSIIRSGPEDGEGELLFLPRRGINRLTAGALYREYSVDGESLTNPGSFESIEGYKNHARVLGKKTGVDVYADGTLSTVSGWARRTMVIEANDIGDDTTSVAQDQAELIERGKQELRAQANRFQRLIEGDIPTKNWNATYYGLGDIVWVKNNEGLKSPMRISETVISQDRTGFKRTPTFEEYYND